MWPWVAPLTPHASLPVHVPSLLGDVAPLRQGHPRLVFVPESALRALPSGHTFLFIGRTECPAPKPGSSVSRCGTLSTSGPLSVPASSLRKWRSWSLAFHGCCEDGLSKDMPTGGLPLSRSTLMQGWAHSRDSGTVGCSDFFLN